MDHPISQATYEDGANPKVTNEPVDAPGCSTTVGSCSSNIHVEGELNPSMKHFMSMEVIFDCKFKLHDLFFLFNLSILSVLIYLVH